MTTRMALWTFVLGLAAAGCLSDDKRLTTVSFDPFGKTKPMQSASFKQAPPATREAALRVDGVGQKLVKANPRLNQKVVFMTLGVPHEEIFHQSQKDSSVIYVSEGLVRQCKTDGELAALLSQELGKMVSEQTALIRSPRSRLSAPPIMNPRVGNDIGDALGGADRVDEMIAARYENEWRQSHKEIPDTPPPPESLARVYLQNAGFDAKALETVAPLLRKAEKQSSVEQSMSGKQTG